MQDDILSVASRRAIFACVGEHAGAHLRDIARRCNMPLGTALYHLDCLETAGLLVARRDGRYKRYFASNGIGRREKEILSLLRHDAPRRIVRALVAADTGATQRELCATIALSRSTLSFHINRLVADGVVERVNSRPEGIYSLREREVVGMLLEKYGQSLATATPAHPALDPAAPVLAVG